MSEPTVDQIGADILNAVRDAANAYRDACRPQATAIVDKILIDISGGYDRDQLIERLINTGLISGRPR